MVSTSVSFPIISGFITFPSSILLKEETWPSTLTQHYIMCTPMGISLQSSGQQLMTNEFIWPVAKVLPTRTWLLQSCWCCVCASCWRCRAASEPWPGRVSGTGPSVGGRREQNSPEGGALDLMDAASNRKLAKECTHRSHWEKGERKQRSSSLSFWLPRRTQATNLRRAEGLVCAANYKSALQGGSRKCRRSL